MINVLFFAGDNKGFMTLRNVIIEAKKRENLHVYALFSTSNALKFPSVNHEDFMADSNFESSEAIQTETLGVIPFVPDVLVIQRERWQPEQSIIHELKTRFGTKVINIEINSQIINTIEGFCENNSRMNYPQSMVDVYIEGSEYTCKRRTQILNDVLSYRGVGGKWGKSVVLGNPRMDTTDMRSLQASNMKDDIDEMNRELGLDVNKKNITVFGCINQCRNSTLEVVRDLVNNPEVTKDYNVIYKPYPGEPANPLFADNFRKDGGMTYIDEKTHMLVEMFYPKISFNDKYTFALMASSEYVLTHTNSVLGLAMQYDTNVVSLDGVNFHWTQMNDVNEYLSERKRGIEDSAHFWANVMGHSSVEEWRDAILQHCSIDKYINDNANFIMRVSKAVLMYGNTLDTWLGKKVDKTTVAYKELEKCFDSFVDGQSSKRIADFIETLQA